MPRISLETFQTCGIHRDSNDDNRYEGGSSDDDFGNDSNLDEVAVDRRWSAWRNENRNYREYWATNCPFASRISTTWTSSSDGRTCSPFLRRHNYIRHCNLNEVTLSQ